MKDGVESAEPTRKAVPVQEGLFTMPPSPGAEGHLIGTRCRSCEETFFGRLSVCGRCQSQDLEEIRLSDRGKLFNYTVLRYPPPPPWKGQSDPYEPLAVGFVELPEGVRVLSLITDCNVEELQNQMEVDLVIRKYFEDEEGNEVYTYMFRPSSKK
jgi:uncharacterized OB-fold protein